MEKDVTVFAVHRKLILLAKFCLDLFEDLRLENDSRKRKLEKVLSGLTDSDIILDVLNLYEPLNTESLDRNRKRILDKANELSREFESDFNKGIR